MNNYSRHYARMNDLDLSSESSLRLWYEKTADYLERELAPHLPSLQNKTILDLGCGIGGMLYYLQKKSPGKLFGVDSSPEQVQFCRRFTDARVYCNDAMRFLKNHRKLFDIIIMYDFIEHFDKAQIHQLLSLTFSRLKTNGILVIRTPNMGAAFAAYHRYIDFTHEVGFTEESIHQILESSGFEDIRVRNSLIGGRRLFALKTIYRFLFRLLNTRLPNIVTDNLLVIARHP